MPNPLNNSGIRDNHRRGAVVDFLKAKIQSGSRLSVVSAYFTIYSYEALKDPLDQIDPLDFLFGEPRFIASLDPDKTRRRRLFSTAMGFKSPINSTRNASPASAPIGFEKIKLKVDGRQSFVEFIANEIHP